MKKCPTCKRQDVLHVGKMSMGWPFTFASDDMGNTIEEVHEKLAKGEIFDEYDKPTTSVELLGWINTREFRDQKLGYSFLAGDFS